MIAKLSDFDAVYALCLDKRWATYGSCLEKEIKRRFGIQIIPFICGDGKLLPAEQYRSIDVTSGPMVPGYSNYSCTNNVLSCKKIFSDAIEKGYENILYLHDNAFAYRELEERLELLAPQINTVDWQVLYFSCSTPNRMDLYDPQTPKLENLDRTNVGATQFSAYKRSCFKTIADMPLLMGSDVWIDYAVRGKYAIINQVSNCYPTLSYAINTLIKRDPIVLAEIEKIRMDGAIVPDFIDSNRNK